MIFFFFFSSRRRHTRLQGDWSSDVCSSDLLQMLKEASERAKIDVGRDGVAKINVEGICQDPNGKVMDLSASLSEAEFNKMVMDLVQRTFKVCDEALQSAKMTAQDLDA